MKATVSLDRAAGTTTILVRDFPVTLHREMKAEAARRGVNVKALYADAVRAFLMRGGKQKGGK